MASPRLAAFSRAPKGTYSCPQGSAPGSFAVPALPCDQRTQHIERNVAEIKSGERIAELDRDWMIQQQQFLTRDKKGNTTLPTSTGAIVGSVVVTIFGSGWTILVASSGGPPFFILFGVVFVLIGIFGTFSRLNKADRYKQAERDYREQRSELSRRRDEG